MDQKLEEKSMTHKTNSQSLMAPQNLAEAITLSQHLAKSDIVPTSFKGRPENILIAIGMGAEVGLNPFQALQSIYVVNGRPSLWGDAVLGLVQSSGLLEYIDESYDSKFRIATCRVKRKNDPIEAIRHFSMDDAKNAGLLDQAKPTWKLYPARMCQMRARSWAIRDKFADVMKGLQVREEMEDIVETTSTNESPEAAPLRRSEVPVVDGVTTTPDLEVITPEERKALGDLAVDKGWDPKNVRELLERRFGVDSSIKLPRTRLEEFRDILVNGEPAPEPS